MALALSAYRHALHAIVPRMMFSAHYPRRIPKTSVRISRYFTKWCSESRNHESLTKGKREGPVGFATKAAEYIRANGAHAQLLLNKPRNTVKSDVEIMRVDLNRSHPRWANRLVDFIKAFIRYLNPVPKLRDALIFCYLKMFLSLSLF